MKKLVWILLVCSMLLLLASCSAAAAPVTTATEARDQLTPYLTATLTPTFTATLLNQPTSTPRPTITPTPRTYVVHANDTFLSIAYYYGITLDELVAANPNINPALMPIGTNLIIPPAREATGTAAAPTPTPFGVTSGELDCFQSASGGLHCFVLMENERKNPASNLTAKFTLVNAAGDETGSRVVTLALRLLEPGARIPFYTYFAPPLENGTQVFFNLLTATRADKAGAAVQPLVVKIDDLAIQENGRSARAAGSVVLENGGVNAKSITLVAVAYDSLGNVIGLRRVEEKVSLPPQTPDEFSIEVFSVGGKILSVEIYAEAEM